jgi:hypothetical protein
MLNLNQPVQPIEERVTKFVKCVQRRNVRETIAACALITIFGLDIIYGIYSRQADSFLRIGGVVIIAALLLDIIIIWRELYIPKSELIKFPPIQHPGKWRRRLTHHARMLKLTWLWYLLPLFLGLLIYYLEVFDQPYNGIIVPITILVTVFATIWRLNRRAAQQIEEDRDIWFGNLQAD